MKERQPCFVNCQKWTRCLHGGTDRDKDGVMRETCKRDYGPCPEASGGKPIIPPLGITTKTITPPRNTKPPRP